MNRGVPGEPNPLQQASSGYLVYLFIFSAAFIVLLPYLSPMGGKLLRSSKKVDVAGKVKSDTFKKASPSTYTSLPSDAMMKKVFYSESKCEALEAIVMDLQRIVRTEREKTLNLEDEIRFLHRSEGILKGRIQKLEDESSESKKDLYSSYTPPAELGVRTTPPTGGRRENLDALVHELSKMVQTEKDRTTALEMQIRNLQRSETSLMDRIQNLEEKFALLMDNCKQTDVCEIENERQGYTKI